MKNVNLFGLLTIGLLAMASCQKNGAGEMDELNEAAGAANKNVEGKESKGALYLIDNSAAANHVLAYYRSANGSISYANKYATGGKGSGAGLGSQGAVIIDDQNEYLYAVNAGSNEISSFKIGNDGLTLVDKEPSRGVMPVSITVDKNILYVLNAGGNGNIAGFVVNKGELSPITNAMQPLSSTSAGAAQVSFNKMGTYLVVTEKATNIINVYPVNKSGVAGAGMAYPSAGQTPFGFAFTNKDELIVSDAFGGMAGKSAMSSYNLDKMGMLKNISVAVPTTQTAACWVVITNNGRYTYTSNTGSSTITGYSISNDGSLSRLNADGVTARTGGGPIDMALSNNSRYLYSLNAKGQSISVFAVESTGALMHIGDVSGLPATAYGLAVK